MPFPVSESGGGDWTPVPAGLHVARCCRVFDLGLQPSTFGDKHVAMLGWEVDIPMEGRSDANRIVSQRFTPSLSAKSNLRKLLESWRGRAFSEQELASFDLFNVLGAWCQLAVVHSVPNARGEVYVNVSSAFPLAKGAPRFEAREQLIGIALDECRPPNAMELLGRSMRTKIEAGHAKLRAGATGAPTVHDRPGMGQQGGTVGQGVSRSIGDVAGRDDGYRTQGHQGGQPGGVFQHPENGYGAAHGQPSAQAGYAQRPADPRPRYRENELNVEIPF